MSEAKPAMADMWRRAGTRFLPFADAGTDELPLARLLRLALFQISVGMAAVLLTGTLNRVMIVELGVSTTLVAVMVSLPFLFAPARALIGFKSDTHKSLLGWKRVPYIWFGTLIQFGGLAIMPFALLLLQSQAYGPTWAGPVAAGFAFLLTGIGLHTTQTAGLALATDLAPETARPRVVALMYVMLLVGMFLSALVFSGLLVDFSPKRLIQVVQGAAVVTMVLNVIALWKQEPRRPAETSPEIEHPSFSQAWSEFRKDRRSSRLLVAVGLGTAGFSMQDVLLEPYGAEVLGLSVSQTTLLTALFAAGSLLGFAMAGRMLGKGRDPHRLAALGTLIGVVAFCCVIFAAPLQSALMFRVGSFLIGMGGGLFAVGTLTASMDLAETAGSGLALGAWGAVQASAVGIGLAAGGIIRDTGSTLALSGAFGPGLRDTALGYSFVYHIEIGLLFAALIAIGPLVRTAAWDANETSTSRNGIGLAELPG
ncbi:BCD family MFS transporter [Pseudahrensia aquimaris]|uniref:BCD family MFS transporter n=1 Tax=Pseudahrensia aquimaris TaxID=744461 RepID=A0ABW3FJW9_9HYPH